MGSKLLAYFQKLGKALMVPIAVLPAAGLLLRLGQADVLNIAWLANAGGAVFDSLPLLFAIGIAVGLAKENNGVAGLSAVVGYLILTKVATTFDKNINMGVLAGVVVGMLCGALYNKYHEIKLPNFLGFFGGRRFVPIITALVTLILGIIAGYIWPMFQMGIDSFGNAIASSGSIGTFIYGVFNRLLIPVGLHHVLNSLIWFQFGSFTTAAGLVVHGDLPRFFALDPTAGFFMGGFFPIMMMGLPAACLAMITVAKPKNRKQVSGMLISIALTAFLTGVTEPIEFTFMFVAPLLYLFHALMTGASLALCTLLGAKSGFTFSAGLIDYVLSFGIASKPLILIIIGLIWGAIYYTVFVFAIKKWNLPTPGRYDDETVVTDVMSSFAKDPLAEQAQAILQVLGGKDNIENVDACITRLRLVVKDSDIISDKRLKELGANGVIRLDKNNIQVVVGTIAENLANKIKKIM